MNWKRKLKNLIMRLFCFQKESRKSSSKSAKNQKKQKSNKRKYSKTTKIKLNNSKKRLEAEMEFSDAVEIVLELEGGYIDHANDPGGETNFGISKRAYPQLDIKNLTKKDAKQIYFQDYWMKCRCEELPGAVRLMVLDCAVNQGVHRALNFIEKIKEKKPEAFQDSKKLFVEFMELRKNHYFSLRNFKIFGKGWINRLFHVYHKTFLFEK